MWRCWVAMLKRRRARPRQSGKQRGHIMLVEPILTFSHNFRVKDQKKSREKVEPLTGRLRARLGCRAIRATAFSSPVARPLCVPNSPQSEQWCANTLAWLTGQPAPRLWQLPLAPPQRAASGWRAAWGSAGRWLAVARAAPLLGPAAPASGATPRNFAAVAARRDSPF